jgi:hypothetical protein
VTIHPNNPRFTRTHFFQRRHAGGGQKAKQNLYGMAPLPVSWRLQPRECPVIVGKKEPPPAGAECTLCATDHTTISTTGVPVYHICSRHQLGCGIFGEHSCIRSMIPTPAPQNSNGRVFARATGGERPRSLRHLQHGRAI